MRMGEHVARPQIRPAARVLGRAGYIGAERIGRMPAPARVIEERASERDTIGPPFGDNRLGLMRVGDHADRLDGDLAVAFDGLGKRHLISWSDGRLRLRRNPAARYAN